MPENNKLTKSLEDYLEAILQLERKQRVARVKDIASLLGVQMPSVTGALKILKGKGFVNYEKNSFIHLTDRGLKTANFIQKKHTILKNFLKSILSLGDEEADDQACRIEHVISLETALKLQNLEKFIHTEVFNKKHITEREWETILTREIKN